jgi:2-polyprenyl-3-methyl-5-hydroxy-6-metoxy-1,4-benzoquinol methylase
MENDRSTEDALRRVAVGQCPICYGKQAEIAFTGFDRLYDTPGEFTYRRCLSCDTVYQDPRIVPEELVRCYPANYYTHRRPPESQLPVSERVLSGVRDRLRRSVVAAVAHRGSPVPPLGKLLSKSRWVRERAFSDTLIDEILPSNTPPGRALDVGCGAGILMLALRAAATARIQGGTVTIGDFREVSLPNASYQLVVLDHVLEHLDDPRAALQRIATLLSPGGIVVLKYPNPHSLGRRLFGDRWFHWDVPRHLVMPAWASLVALAADFQLRLKSRRSTARRALTVLANSRSYSAGLSVDLDHPRPLPKDYALAAAEHVLVKLGILIGEEVILALERRP